jgi:Flp pilus assembly protein TadD
MVHGLDAWANGRRPEALKWFRVAVGVAPNDSMAWHDLGVALYAASRYDDALDAFVKERFLVPLAPSASYGVGECELALGRLADAERDLLVAISMAPREWEYWQTLSEIFVAEHRDEAARAALARAVALRPRAKRVVWSHQTIERAILSLRIPPIAISR